ncbi:ejaculatory bulb-specific protein 3-like isoform X2 [Helicoverpa zea]|uniref:ejaculatory bulb-specific protein 3-like isoform X2 n=1 Tax=Helicoverpa zea TaxID=7113 RepID=UPI001F5AEFD3|nr:ejaculatory bulb-specific protein 3-like isoform X2 [Helicoverpa zea]
MGPRPPAIATVDAVGAALHNFLSYQASIKMRSWLICLCVLTVVVTCHSQAPNRYENFNADAIIQNDRILLAYYKCVMDKGPCTRDGKNFKRVLPETLATACGRCNPKQKTIVRKLLLGIRSKSEPRFLELLDKYNPDRSNRDALYAFLVTGN